MKYVAGIVLFMLLVCGVFFGFTLGRSNNGSSGISQSSSEPTNNSTSSPTKSSVNATVVNLSNKELTKVTSDIYGKTATTDLILSNNSIKTLPSEMGRMNNLTSFRIDHNLLEGNLIGEIRQMSQLKQLDVSYNSMTGVPAEIGQLSNLQTLNYSYNKIDSLPNELANLKNTLKECNLTGNPLSQEKINKLKAQLPNTNVIF